MVHAVISVMVGLVVLGPRGSFVFQVNGVYASMDLMSLILFSVSQYSRCRVDTTVGVNV